MISKFRVLFSRKPSDICAGKRNKGTRMKEQEIINYNRVKAAISYIRQHFREQPSLETIAEKVNLSPFHFQRLRSEEHTYELQSLMRTSYAVFCMTTQNI